MIISSFFNIAIGCLAAAQFAIISTLLPAIFGSFFTFVITKVLAPSIAAICYLLVQHFPPVLALIPILCLTPIHIAAFPCANLITLVATVSLTAFRNRRAFLLTTTAFLLTHYLLYIRTIRIFPVRLHISVLVAALTLAELAMYSQMLRTLLLSRTPLKTDLLRPKRRMKRPQKAIAPRSPLWAPLIGFILSFSIISLSTPFAASLLRSLNPRPLPPGFSVHAQRRSTTGLVSVVQVANSHRMLTADLSVLGGYHTKEGYDQDSIFSQFHVHEAVRLSLRNEFISPDPSAPARALCIGVGVGVVAGALRAHKLRVDPVEIDPTVSAFATQWFGFGGNIVVDDALNFIETTETGIYDYVVHDVFTGGAVPSSLISTEVLRRIRVIMKPSGVFAINVVAHTHGLGGAITRIVHDRLKNVFGHVRIFSDNKNDRTDNLVLFASRDARFIQFRKPVEDDFLGSRIREMTLLSFESNEILRQDLPEGWHVPSFSSHVVEGIELWCGLALVGADHANLMRRVHPPALFPALLAAESGP